MLQRALELDGVEYKHINGKSNIKVIYKKSQFFVLLIYTQASIPLYL